MRYHADLQWVRMAFRDFSRTVMYTELRNEVRALENPTGQGALPLTATTHVSA